MASCSEANYSDMAIAMDTIPSSENSRCAEDEGLIRDLKRSVECPVCMEIPVPPIMLCMAGHAVCSYCLPRLSKCPVCGSGFSTIRNFSMEAIVGHFPQDCRNLLCNENMKTESIRDHMDICQFREIVCEENQNDACFGKKIPFPEYAAHLVSVHQYQRIEQNEETAVPAKVKMNLMPTSGSEWVPCIVEFDGATFLIKAKSFDNKTTTIWFVALLGEADANKYRLVMDFYRADKLQAWKTSSIHKLTAHNIHAPLEMSERPGQAVDSRIPVIPNHHEHQFAIECDVLDRMGVVKPYWTTRFVVQRKPETVLAAAAAPVEYERTAEGLSNSGESTAVEIAPEETDFHWAVECNIQKSTEQLRWAALVNTRVNRGRDEERANDGFDLLPPTRACDQREARNSCRPLYKCRECSCARTTMGTVVACALFFCYFIINLSKFQ